jgi:hypothetical protein
VLTGCLSGVLGVPVAKLGRTGTKGTELATTAGVGYLDARLQGQSPEEALLAGGQSALTSASLQRVAGNRAVNELLQPADALERSESSTAGRACAHLYVNQPDDAYEREAERGASQLVWLDSPG